MGSKRSHLNCSSLTISRDIFMKIQSVFGYLFASYPKVYENSNATSCETIFGLIVQGGRNQERTSKYGTPMN